MSAMAESSPQSTKKRGRDSLDASMDDDSSAHETPTKRRNETTITIHREPSSRINAEGAQDTAWMPIAIESGTLEPDQAGVGEGRAQPGTPLEDTTGWTLLDFIKKPIPQDNKAAAADPNGTAPSAAPRPYITLPTVRSSRPAASDLSQIDIDPAVSLMLPPEPSFAPQVRIDERGQLVVEASITQLETQDTVVRTVVEGGRTHITSATYQRRPRTHKWGPDDIKKLYDALSMCGTDFSLIEMFFPDRTRAHVKARFKVEEKVHPDLIEAALRNKKPINVEQFKKLIAEKKAYFELHGSNTRQKSANHPQPPARPATTEASASRPPAATQPQSAPRTPRPAQDRPAPPAPRDEGPNHTDLPSDDDDDIPRSQMPGARQEPAAPTRTEAPPEPEEPEEPPTDPTLSLIS